MKSWLSLFVLLALPLSAQTVVNGGFEEDAAGWSVANTLVGAGAPGDLRSYDIDGPGPLGLSQVLHLNAGKQLGATSGGVDLAQSVSLEAGQEYAARFHWALRNTGVGSYTNTAKLRLIVFGVSSEITEFIVVGPGQEVHGAVEDVFTAPSTGSFDLVVRIESLGVADARFDQYIDNVVIGPAADVFCSQSVASNGCVALIAGHGAPSLASPAPFDVTASSVLNNKAGLLFYGLSGPAQTYLPAWDGVLCVQPPLRRTAIQFSAGGPPPDDCSGALSYDFNARIRSGVDPLLVPGQTVHSQYWFRDPAKLQGIGVSLTPGLSFTVGP